MSSVAQVGRSRKGNVLCFMVDTTQSMQNWIAAVRTILSECADIGTMTHAFDAFAVLEYGDYDSVWCAKAHAKNVYHYSGGGDYGAYCSNAKKDANVADNVPVRFSGWGVIGAEATRKLVVVDDAARVSMESVHTFASNLVARGGGRVPEAVKTALVEFASICKHTLNDQCRVHLIHLTDAPLHMDMKGLDAEGLKEKAALCGTASATMQLPASAKLTPFSTMSVYSHLLKTFSLSPFEMLAFEAAVKEAKEAEAAATAAASSTAEDAVASRPPQPAVYVPPSRLHYTCICNKPLVSGPYAVLAHLTEGHVVAPPDVEVGTLRDVLLGVLNRWMGISNASKKGSGGEGADSSPNPLKGNVCHLLYKNNVAAEYSLPSLTSSRGGAKRGEGGRRAIAEISMDLTDDKLDAACKCRRHEIVAGVAPAAPPAAPVTASMLGSAAKAVTKNQNRPPQQTPVIDEPIIAVQPGLRMALKRCLAKISRTSEEKTAAGSGKKGSKKGASSKSPSADHRRNAYLDGVADVLKRLASSSPLALASSPALGKIWRAFTRRREDPRRDEFLALLQKAVHALQSEEDKGRMTAWLEESFDTSDEIQKELRAFVQENGIKGLVVYEGADEGFVPRSLSNAFVGCDREAQATIMSMLVRMRINRRYVAPSLAAEEEAARAADETEGMEQRAGSPCDQNRLGNGTSSSSYFVGAGDDDDEEDDFDDSALLDDDSDDDDANSNAKGPILPPNSLPLNLPLPSLFRLLLSTVVPGTQLTRRPAAIVAALAFRSGSVLRVPAALYLQSLCGQWLSYQMLPTVKQQAPKTKGSAPSAASASYAPPPAALTPMMPENYVGAFMRLLLNTDKQMKSVQSRHATKHENEEGKEAEGDNPSVNDDGSRPDGPDSAADTNASHKQALLTGRILTPQEHASLKQLLRLSLLLRADDWEVNARLIDVDSADGVTADYVLKCVVCGQDRPWSLVDSDGQCGYCHCGRTPEGRHKNGNQLVPDPNWVNPTSAKDTGKDKKKGSVSAGRKQKLKAPLIPPPPAPAAASATGTYQVRCGNCYGFYSRDDRRTVIGGHRCFYCREATAVESAQQIERSRTLSRTRTAASQGTTNESPTAQKGVSNDNDEDNLFPHLQTCVECQSRVVGAPGRPLPNGGRCAPCAARLRYRSNTTTERTMRIVRLFPYRLFWRDLASAVRLETVPQWDRSVVGPTAAPSQNSLSSASQAFKIPCITRALRAASGDSCDVAAAADNDNDNANNGSGEGICRMEEPAQQPITSMPPNRFIEAERIRMRTLGLTSRGSASDDTTTGTALLRRFEQQQWNPFVAVENISELWSSLVTSIFEQRFGGEVPFCAVCCEEFPSNGAAKLQPTCGRRGCEQRMCIPCGKEWYGSEDNRIGHILAPRRLYCPCCSRAPQPKILRMFNADAAFNDLPRQVAALNTDRFIIAWCRSCTKPREYMEKVCGARMGGGEGGEDGAGRAALTDYLCDYCLTIRIATRHACPHCKVPTIRSSGCFHMTCICGGHWCYDCGEALDACDPYNHSCEGPAQNRLQFEAFDEYDSEREDEY